MPFDPNDEVTFRLLAGEVDELLAGLQRSIKWSQQIMSKIVLQAQAQAQPQPPNGNSTASSSRRRGDGAAT